MANPPVNRRPGVDADIIQGTWVRGYDVPAGDQTLPVPQPCDLIVSNGKSQIDQTLSNLIFAQRTDSPAQPVFVMAQGDDPEAPIGTVNFHIGEEDDPNGVISGVGPGALYASYGTPGLWQLQADDTTWVQISDELGGENLAETLAIGNFTGNNSIVLSDQPLAQIIGEENTVGGDGAQVTVLGGPATGATGDGGSIFLTGGTSAGGVTGTVGLFTPPAAGTGVSGQIQATTGGNTTGGDSGGVSVTTGNVGAAGVAGTSGTITLRTGAAFDASGVLGVAGNLNLETGNAFSSGQGGNITVAAGSASAGVFPPPVLPPVAGKGGTVRIQAGLSSLTNTGGDVSITAGGGGSGGAAGGNVTLTPGTGGGGFPDGEVVAQGILRADNIKRGSGDPNGSVSGDEGDVYQRIDSALGQLWLNTNGTSTGWVQLAAVGDFIESFEQLNWGYFSRAGKDLGGAVEDAWFDGGLFKGLRSNSTAGDDPTFGGNLDNGPYVSFSPPANADVSAVDLSAGAGNFPHAREQRFILTFRARNSVTASNGRIFLGVSTLDAQTQLSSPIPGGGSYLGFLLDGSVGATWRVVTSNGLGTTGPLDTGILDTTVSATTEGWHFIIDVTDTATPVVRFFILDPDLQVQASLTVPTTLPSLSTPMGLVMGSRRINGVAPNPTLQVVHASLVNDADVSGQGGGTVAGLSLSQVLINGNTTGTTTIEVNQGSGLFGVTDDDLGDGASFGIFGGTTTLATNDTGAVTLASGNASGGGAEDPGSTTGNVTVSSGFQLAATSEGDTGIVDLQSGDHVGTDGTTGDLLLRTGGFTNGAAGTRTQGDILIGAGSFTPNTATVTGEVIIKGGSSSLSGVTGGDVTITSGENSSPSGDTGNIIVETFPATTAGDSGTLTLRSGDAGAVSGDSGNLDIETGDAPGTGDTGALTVTTGDASSGAAGSLLIGVGSSTSGPGTALSIVGGDTTDGGQVGGQILLTPGTGPAGDGDVVVNGKLTVTGLIDPTGLLLDGQAAIPATPAGGQGLLWIDSTAVPSRLFFTDDAGTDHDISTGGGVTSLGALTDVVLTAPAAGEVLTFNGGSWVNLPGVGGSPLSTILAIGNTTGATPIVVEDSLGSSITSDGDLVLDPAIAGGNRVVIDGLAWPESDGAAGFVLTTNGAGVLSFQAASGGTGPSFGEVFTRMQWGSVQSANLPATFQADGMFGTVTLTSDNPAFVTHATDGYFTTFDTAAAGGDSKGLEVEQTGPGIGVELQALPVVSFKFDGPSLDTNIRFFVGLTDAPTVAAQTGVALPVQRYVGIQIYDDIPQTTLHFVTDDATGTPTTFDTGVSALGTAFELVVDATTAGQVSLTLYDDTGTQLAQHTFAANLPLATAPLGLQHGMTTLNATAKTSAFYTVSAVTRGDLLNAVGGGGGSQDLASVLGFGNETNGVPIQGDDNVAGSGGALDLLGGSSSGAGGAGGSVNVVTGSPDPGGSGGAGDFTVTTATGAGTGDGGDFAASLGDGGPGGGDGGGVTFTSGAGVGVGNGGSFDVFAGDSGTAGGAFSGSVTFTSGSGGVGSGATAGRFRAITGTGDGTGNGGLIELLAGDGGAGGGDGGSVLVSPGAGNGGGADGTITLDGDTTVSGKLTVTGLIDPPGLLMSSSGAVPFTPAGSEGGIWVNGAGELIFTNLGGDLNLSTAIGGGMTFLDAMLTAGYGMLSAGNPTTGPESYGVYGSSSVVAVSPGPPPASATFGDDSDGPFLNLAVAGDPLSEAFIGAADLFIQRDSQFKARFKFQVTSPAHTDQRIFIGFTDDPAVTTPSAQLAADDPAAQQYVGIRQDLTGANLDFVARGSGGAMVPVFGIPTDAAVHYLEIDASAASGDVTFSIIAADGTTVEATHTEPASLLLPDLPTSLRPFFGIHTSTGTTPRAMDFYYSTIVTRADVVDAVTGGGSGGTPALAAVLAAGNTAGGTSIEADGGVAGGTATLALSGGAGGGAGSPATLDLAVESGDDGGAATLLSGAGAGAAGAGGALTLEGSSGAGTGAGGDVSLLAGDGGAGGGDAGSVTVAAGTPVGAGAFGDMLVLGDKTAPIPASLAGLTDGAAVLIAASSGGATGASAGALRGEATGAGRGGVAFLTGGDAAAASGSVGGGVTLTGGTGDGGGGGGNISIASGTGGASGSGGLLSLFAGTAAGGSGGDGGDVVITAGIPDGAGTAGSVQLLGHNATALVAPGGEIQLVGASETGSADGAVIAALAGDVAAGGEATVRGGAAVGGSGLPGGEATVTGGASDGVSDGAAARLRGGSGGATGDGGDAQVEGGAATGGANVGGDVRLTPGSGPAGTGEVRVEGALNQDASGIKFGTASGFVGMGPHAINFTTAFPSAPRVVQITVESGSVPNEVAIDAGSVTATGFSVLATGTLAGGDVIHWVAYL